GNVTGGLSGPAIKPLVLRLVWQTARQVNIPIIGVGGIATVDDVMGVLLAGAGGGRFGAGKFFEPTAAHPGAPRRPPRAPRRASGARGGGRCRCRPRGRQ